MTTTQLQEIDGIGEVTIPKLIDGGVETRAELETALRQLEPPAGEVYSSGQLAVLDALDLPTIGAETVAQYTRQIETDAHVRYEWVTETTTYVAELTEAGEGYRAEVGTDDGETLRTGLYDDRSDAVEALTRWAYRPPEIL